MRPFSPSIPVGVGRFDNMSKGEDMIAALGERLFAKTSDQT